VVQTIWAGQPTFKLFHKRQQELVTSSPIKALPDLAPGSWVGAPAGRSTHASSSTNAAADHITHSDVDFRSSGVRYIERIYDCLNWIDLCARIGRRLQLPAVDLVILRKNDNLIHVRNCTDAAKRIAGWRIAGAPDFRFLCGTSYLLVFGTSKNGGGNYGYRLIRGQALVPLRASRIENSFVISAPYEIFY
jgi:hypothetical protein